MIPVSRPFFDNKEPEAVESVLNSGWIGLGPKVKEFEDMVKEFLSAPNFLAVNTGTSALHLSLEILGLEKDDEVIMPAMTFTASPQAVLMAGGKPVFCDIGNDLNMRVESVKKLISAKTKVIMPVHFRGKCCDLDNIFRLAEDNGATVIEDAAHAFGSKYRGRYLGSFGHITCFSFDPIKNITCGEGGGIVFQDSSMHERALVARNLGVDRSAWDRGTGGYDVTCPGFRYHMPDMCAAIGLVQMSKFHEMKRKRIEICKLYDSAFRSLRRASPIEMDYSCDVPFLYVLLVEDRPKFMEWMSSNNIATGIHYRPLTEFSMFGSYDCDIMNLSTMSDSMVSIPMFPGMSDLEIFSVIDGVKGYDSI